MFSEINLFALGIFVATLLISTTIHEFMHGYVAFRLGDPTARDEGRLTFNPLAHIDPFLTVALPIITFLLPPHMPILAAKPVPFTPWRVRYQEWGVALLAVAGPLSNFVLAVIGSLVARAFGVDSIGYAIMYYFSMLNIVLFVFNLVPIPPLDGSRVLYALLPEGGRRFLEQLEGPVGFFLVFILVAFAGLGGALSGFYTFFMNLLF